jgi:hypothetical protein
MLAVFVSKWSVVTVFLTGSTPLADGTKVTKSWEVQKWRDSQGRFRKERAVVEDGKEPVFDLATILGSVEVFD